MTLIGAKKFYAAMSSGTQLSIIHSIIQVFLVVFYVFTPVAKRAVYIKEMMLVFPRT